MVSLCQAVEMDTTEIITAGGNLVMDWHTVREGGGKTIERFSFAFTANGKRQAAACRKSKKIILF